MRRAIAALALAGAMLLAGPASAAVTGLHVDTVAVLRTDGGVNVHGTVECTSGQAYVIRITLKQDTGRGTHRSRWTCESGPDNFTLAVQPSEGTFHAGRARVNVVVVTADQDSAQVQKVLKVVEE